MLVEGTVLEALPNGLFRIECEPVNGTRTRITASLGGTARQATVRILPGDRVLVQISSRDPSRGKVTRRLM